MNSVQGYALRRTPIRRRFFLLTAVNVTMVALLLALFLRYEAVQEDARQKQAGMQQLDLALRSVQSDSNRLLALIRQYIEQPEAGAQEAATRLGKSLLTRVSALAAEHAALRAPLSSAQGAVGVLVTSFDRLVTLNAQITSGFEVGVLNTARDTSALFDKAAATLQGAGKSGVAQAHREFVGAALNLSAFYFRPQAASADTARDSLERVLDGLKAVAAPPGEAQALIKALTQSVQGLESALLRLESLMLERSGLMRVDVGVNAQRLITLSDGLLADNQKLQAQLLERYHTEQQWALFTLIALALLVTGTGGFLGWLIARSVQQPLVSLMQSVDAFAAGDLTHEVPGQDAPDELGSLSRTLQTLKTGAHARHEAEAALRQSEERYRNVVDNVPETIIIAQGQQLIFANPRASELTGLALPELLTRSFVELLHPDDVELVAERYRKRMAGEPVERYTRFRVRHADGSHIWVESSAVAVTWDGKPATLAFIGDLTDRRRAEESVRAALDRQQELNDLRTRFIAMASHEFRTPLATILSSAELLRDYGERLPEDERREVMRAIESGVQRMATLLDDVLTVGSVDSGKIEFHPSRLALKAFCSSVVAEVTRSESRQGRGDRKVLLEATSDAAAVLDEQLLRHALGNVLSNAIKYSAPGGEVRFGAAASAGHATFVIEDNGIGIPPEDLPHLFETFHRGRNTKGVPGTGLGLAIAKKAVEIHRGTITVDSAPGKGTRITLQIPLGD